LVFDFGIAEGTEQLPGLVADLIRRKADVILASGTPAVLPARNVCSKAPSAEHSRNQVTLAFRLSSMKQAPWRRVMFAPNHCLQAAS
jgi:hypothetical protein